MHFGVYRETRTQVLHSILSNWKPAQRSGDRTDMISNLGLVIVLIFIIFIFPHNICTSFSKESPAAEFQAQICVFSGLLSFLCLDTAFLGWKVIRYYPGSFNSRANLFCSFRFCCYGGFLLGMLLFVSSFDVRYEGENLCSFYFSLSLPVICCIFFKLFFILYTSICPK